MTGTTKSYLYVGLASRRHKRCFRDVIFARFLRSHGGSFHRDLQDPQGDGDQWFIRARVWTDEDRTYFLIRLPVHKRVAVTQAEPQVTGQVQKLLEVLDEEMSRGEIQGKLGLAHRDNFSNSYLKPALDAGLIEMTIPDKPHSSKQKYRLTQNGQQWLSQHGGSP